ncbi:hypothetical protein Q9189_006045 [Teloschistes chrysophthalmus]
MMKFCRYVCAGTDKGAVNFLDPDTLEKIESWQAYTDQLSDMYAQNDYLVTCGWAHRLHGARMLEPFARVYNLRIHKLDSLMPFHGGPAFVQMHPKLFTTSILASATGSLQVVDIMNPDTSSLHQANLANYMTHLVLAPSGAAMALADVDGAVQIWAASKSKLRYTESSTPTEFADEIYPLPPMNIDSDLTVGMPYYREKLLSAWSEDHVYQVGLLPPRIDPDILKQLDPSHIGYRASNPRKTLRNQIDRLSIVDSDGTALTAPKFLSEKERDTNDGTDKDRRISDADVFTNSGVIGSIKADVPAMYQLMEIKYSRFGVDDFDFGFYNKTQFSGLETHITNSYLNPLLQLFKYTPLFRNAALHHAASSCLTESCLLCELGYLFDMLEKAGGQKCHATNFLKAFSSHSEASKLQLTEETSPPSSLESRIQAANRFLLKQVAADYQRHAFDAKLDLTLTTQAFTNMRCTNCSSETLRSNPKHLIELSYHALRMNPRMRNSTPAFSRILQDSFDGENRQRMWCDRERRYQPLDRWETTQNVPAILMINTGLNKQVEARQLWSVPGWLPDRIGIVIEKGRLLCLEGEALRVSQRSRQSRPLVVYDLVGLVADVSSVALSSRNPQEDAQWHLFNDFLVRKVDRHEALQFDATWKTPTILAYQCQGVNNAVDDSWRDSLDISCLFQNWSLNPQHVLPENWPNVLDVSTERPVEGTYVPIDTEFVQLKQEEVEISATGNREIVRPTREGLARVSVLRASGPCAGVPFIDDYVFIHEPVVDYVTKFSGMIADDLNPALSLHPLVPLKVAYKKLWILLNIGCIFVGHGLVKDFRTINIFVPKAQIVDTVTLFYNPTRTKRSLGLRFLAWYLLKEDIQTTTHDSIEDALTALKLWRKYQEFEDAGIVDKMVKEIYAAGKKWNYRVPEKGSERWPGGLMTVSNNRGREDTPDMDSGVSGPTTPVKPKHGSEYFESPLK